MEECPNLANCMFFKKYDTDEKHQKSLTNFIKYYCKGDKQYDCVRRRIKEKFGMDKVPVNMMPNGMPFPDTTHDDWDPEIIKASYEH